MEHRHLKWLLMIRDEAEPYYLQRLEESADPVRRAQITLDQIELEHDISVKRISYATIFTHNENFAGLYMEQLNDLTGLNLTAFQRVMAVIVTAMTKYGAQNLQDHTQLVQSFAKPLDWLNGSVYKDQETGWTQLSIMLNVMKHTNDVSVIEVDEVCLNSGVRALFDHIMNHCDISNRMNFLCSPIYQYI